MNSWAGFSDSLMSEQSIGHFFFHVWENYPYVTLLTGASTLVQRRGRKTWRFHFYKSRLGLFWKKWNCSHNVWKLPKKSLIEMRAKQYIGLPIAHNFRHFLIVFGSCYWFYLVTLRCDNSQLLNWLLLRNPNKIVWENWSENVSGNTVNTVSVVDFHQLPHRNLKKNHVKSRKTLTKETPSNLGKVCLHFENFLTRRIPFKSRWVNVSKFVYISEVVAVIWRIFWVVESRKISSKSSNSQF